MKFALIFFAVLLIGVASSEQISEAVGPYNVNFSLPVDVVLVNELMKTSETYSGNEYTDYGGLL